MMVDLFGRKLHKGNYIIIYGRLGKIIDISHGIFEIKNFDSANFKLNQKIYYKTAAIQKLSKSEALIYMLEKE
jgi:hypothetical protein